MISQTIQTLLDRMDKFPEEFIDTDVGANYAPVEDMVEDTRWGGVTISIANQAQGRCLYNLYTPEEVSAYMDKFTELIRKKVDEDICASIVRFDAQREEKTKQMELPFDRLETIRANMEAYINAQGIPATVIRREE